MTPGPAPLPPETLRPTTNEAQERRHGQLIVAALTGPIAWGVHFLFVYLMVEMACQTGVLSGVALGLTTLIWINLAATVLALGVVAWAGLRAFRAWRAAQSARTKTRAERSHETTQLVRGPEALLGLAGWALSLLFGAAILLTAVPMLMYAPCAWM